MDLQILGLGTTGHIAFNEPDSTFHPFTRLVNLDKSTMAANGHFFKTNEAVPHQAVTVGMRFILNSRLILLLVSSDKKKLKHLSEPLTARLIPWYPHQFCNFIQTSLLSLMQKQDQSCKQK